MSILIAPDSFKGSLSAKEVSEVIKDTLKQYTDEETITLPIADGGEGSLDTILSCTEGRKKTISVLSPDQRTIQADYGMIKQTAIIEMATASGITKQNGLHPMTATTYGTGQLIKDALDQGIRDFKLCIGGSATTDGGCGMAAALGYRFFDENNNEFIPSGKTLKNIHSIIDTDKDPRIEESTFTVLSDVNNPLFGTNGAAYVYGPQKGANNQQVKELDEGLRHYAEMLIKYGYGNYKDIPGAGAAGGLGAGAMAFLNAKLTSGIDEILNITRFKEKAKIAKIIYTGEGRLDGQSLSGKVLTGIRNATDKPIISICGSCEADPLLLKENNVKAFAINRYADTKECIANPIPYIQKAVIATLPMILEASQ